MKEIKIDYIEYFNHIKNLKKVLLVAGAGRTGSDFFQSLLDGHPEILQFTGVWFFHIWWKEEAKCKENLSDLINEFIWHTCNKCNHIAKFKSYYDKVERWDQLGCNKNEFFGVDINTFKNHMQNILVDKELNSKNFFLAVNLAYGLATGVDIKKTKILFYHIHHIEKLEEFKKDFADFDVICSIREPRNTLVSAVEHWKAYDIRTYNSRFFYQALNRIFKESEPLVKYSKNIKTLKLEDLHLCSKEVLEEFCKMHNLKFEDFMLKSTYHGKKWWGDMLSIKYLDGFNKYINKKKWKGKLFFYDNILITYILENRLRHYGYLSEKKILKFYLIIVLFFAFLPMKYELKILAYNYSTGQSIKDKIKLVGESSIFYILRIFLYFRFILKKITKKTFLADCIIKNKYY